MCQAGGGETYACVADCATGLTQCGTSCIDTETDVRHCGACDAPCPTRTASTPECAAGACGFACDVGFEDCNARAADGCEVSTQTDSSNCGTCGNACSFPRASASCVTGECRLGACTASFEDCNAMDADGCEVDTDVDPASCGGCGTACALDHASSTCAGGSCIVDACDLGFDDCNGMDADGCEADLASPTTCGDCATSCGAGLSCADGMCACPTGCTCSNTNCRTGGSACSCNTGCTCDFECSASCTVTCNGTCTAATTTMGRDVTYTCNTGAMCTFGARDGNNVNITCNAGSTCVIDCTNANNCDRTRCQGTGVSCQVNCTDANNCDFDSCDGMQASCPGNVIVCNPTGACP